MNSKTRLALLLILFAINYGVAQPANSIDLFKRDSVQSADGTLIGYRQTGHGPGVIVLHGTFEYWQSHSELATALADSFTVYLPDRRGRGASPYSTIEYSIQKDIEDLNALVAKTNARFLFAISSGALVVLNAAKHYPADYKIALYEPPLVMNKVKTVDDLKQFDSAVQKNDLPGALVTAMKASQMGPKAFNYLPRFVLKSFAKKMLKDDSGDRANSEVTVRKLVPTIHHDFAMTIENLNDFTGYKHIESEVLLLGGSKSPAYLKTSLDSLKSHLTDSKRIEFNALGHGGSGSVAWGGDPGRVAKALTEYFLQRTKTTAALKNE